MKYFSTLRFLLLSLLVSCHSVMQGSLAELDEKNGFRDAKFGAPIRNYPGMTLADGDYPLATTKTYVRKTDKLQIGDVKIDPIFYKFFEGRLSEVSFTFSGKREANEILKAFEFLYGTHQVENGWIKWETSKILIWYLPNNTPNGGTLTQVMVISKEMLKLITKNDAIRNEIALQKRTIEEQNKLRKRASEL